MSVSPRLVAIAVGSALMGLAASGVAFPFLADEAAKTENRRLLEDATQRAETRHALFDALITKHRSAIDQFRRRFAALEQAEADALFEMYFPEHPSGARRSRPEDFDGIERPDGRRTFGMGAFIGETDPDPRTRRALVAAYQTVRDVGPASLNRFDSLYYNDERNLVIFAPNREDRLMFYREEAPADFRWDHHEMVQIVQPANNPLGRTVCTGLTDLVYTEEDRVQTIGCHTPVRVNGVHIASFGDTLDVAATLREAVGDTPDGVTATMITRDGAVVSHPSLYDQGVITDEDVRRVAHEQGLYSLGRAVAENGQRAGVITPPGRGTSAAYARLDTPGWFLVLEAEPGLGRVWTALKAAGVGAVIAVLIFFQLALIWDGQSRRSRRELHKAV